MCKWVLLRGAYYMMSSEACKPDSNIANWSKSAECSPGCLWDIMNHPVIITAELRVPHSRGSSFKCLRKLWDYFGQKMDCKINENIT